MPILTFTYDRELLRSKLPEVYRLSPDHYQRVIVLSILRDHYGLPIAHELEWFYRLNQASISSIFAGRNQRDISPLNMRSASAFTDVSLITEVEITNHRINIHHA